MALGDYVGRTVDLTLFQGLLPPGHEALTVAALALPGQGGAVVTGIAKLAQWFLLDFLTPAGSVAADPSAGCNFITDLEAGRLQTTVDVFTSFSFAVGTVQANLQRRARTTDPPDERFAGAALAGLQLAPDQITLGITLTSAAGTAAQLILPLPAVP